ncbi:MAG: hypothetical protein HQL31_06445 [Planctomycetes bacterium]|nr:hypothetical protein [Planctomycetota bacterium]
MDTDLHGLYLRRLERWPSAIRRYLYPLPEDGSLGCFGPGDHSHWSMQANNTAAAAFAVLGTDPGTDAACAGMSQDEMISWALRMIRFSLTSHVAGGGTATDLQPWGNSWISSLCLERLSHGMEALGTRVPAQDQDLLRKVLISESDWLLDKYEVVAGLVSNNKPESNIWNGCTLYRTALSFPEAPRCDEYKEKGTRFLMNGISAPADAACRQLIAGRPVADWHVGANMFDSMACNHHGYLNVGYMVICLSNIAMLHFSCRSRGWAVPEGLYHHALDLWRLVKTCTFPDGRLCRIGGDTRVRYCYCQDYAIPVWLLARDLFGDEDARSLELGWLGILETEAESTADKTFLSARLSKMEAVSPQYYVRLEGDRACTLSMGAYWQRFFGHPEAEKPAQGRSDNKVPILSEWSDDYHGSMLTRSSWRMASWTWRAASSPQGLCVPPDKSSMAEWQGNLGARVLGMGVFNDPKCRSGQLHTFSGGFATCGQTTVHTHGYVSEGDLARDAAIIDLACVALPDERTMVVLQRARVLGRTWLREVKGLFLQIPNDIFNNMRRNYRYAGGKLDLGGCPAQAESRSIPGNWLCIDSCLSVLRVYGPGLILHRPVGRQVEIRSSVHEPHRGRAGGNLYVDEICLGCSNEVRAYDKDTNLFDLGAVILSGVNAEKAEEYARTTSPEAIAADAEEVRSLRVIGADKRHYMVLANFSERETVEPVPSLGAALPRVIAGASVRTDKDGLLRIAIASMHVAVLVAD